MSTAVAVEELSHYRSQCKYTGCQHCGACGLGPMSQFSILGNGYAICYCCTIVSNEGGGLNQ